MVAGKRLNFKAAKPHRQQQINRVRLIPENGEKTSTERLTQSLQDGALITGVTAHWTKRVTLR